MYYFDPAATSLRKPKAVAEAVYQALSSETLGNPSRSGHEASIQASRIIYETRESISTLFKATNYHVVLTKNVTESLNIALKGLFQKGDHLITTTMEHNAVLRPLYELQDQGVSLDFVNGEPETGKLLYQQFETLLQAGTKAVVVTHASNVTGNVTDLKWVSAFCQKHQLKLIVDGAQAAGIIDIDLDELGIDVFCFTGHKSLYGPGGTGGMCIKKGMEIRPLMTGGSGFATFSKTQPTQLPESLEAGTLNVHGIAGLGAGVRYVLEKGIAHLFTEASTFARYFYEQVSQFETVHVYGDPVGLSTGIVALNIGDYDSTEISSLLADDYGILVRSGVHCAPLVHRHFGTETQGMVRFSFSAFNTMDEVKHAVYATRQLVKEVLS